MLDRILRFSVSNRWLVMVGVLLLVAVGVVSFGRLPIDAVPDITNVQVQVNASAPGYSPLEAEQRVTFPLETALAGVPFLDHTRSLSRYGLSQVTAVFDEGTDIYLARQLVSERLQEVRGRLPAGIDPEMGPVATGLGEIFLYTVEAKPGTLLPDGSPATPAKLRTLQDWVIRPRLRTVPGVTEVNSIGGEVREVHVTPRPDELVAFGLGLDDVVRAVARNTQSVGAGFFERNGEQLLVRVPGHASSLDDIARIVVGHGGGVPIRIADIAAVADGAELRTGAATELGREVVLGTALMLMGENSRAVSQRVAAALDEVESSLPPGVEVKPVYDRTALVDRTIATVRTNLLEGAALVMAVLFALLGNLRAAALTALVIPLAMLFTVTGMAGGRVSANLMSLGALDFGLIVDGAVIIVENCLRRLAEACRELGRPLERRERIALAYESAREVVRPSTLGVAIIAIVYLPILTLTGVEGKMFRPMAITVILALLGALVLSLTFVPAAVASFLGSRVSEHEPAVARVAAGVYRRQLDAALRHPWIVLGTALVLVAASLVVGMRLGREFVPSLDEGDFTMHAIRATGTSLGQAVAMQESLEKRLAEIPQVANVFSKIGTAEVATDPMPPSVADTYIITKPRSEWPDPSLPRADLMTAIERAAAAVPGNAYELTQPIQMRMNELLAGVRADLAVKIFGDDLDLLAGVGERAADLLAKVPGAADVRVEPVAGLPMLRVDADRGALALYGLDLEAVQDTVAIAVGGRAAGRLYEGDRRFDVVVRLPEALRNDPEAIRRLPVALPRSTEAPAPAWTSWALRAAGEPARDPLLTSQGAADYVPLSALASFEIAPGPNQVSRENGKRRVVVTANVRGRDLGSFVAEAERAIRAGVSLPTGYWIGFGGQYENLLSATRRLEIVVPLALALIFGLLYAGLGSLTLAGVVGSGVPLALTGGVAALWLRGIPLSISAAVGFIALSGIAVLNGLVMVSFIESLRREGLPLGEAIRRGAVTRLRPVAMTALVASLGFVPMAVSTGAGAEVQRPLATVVIGGILSSTALTLFVLPVLVQLALSRRRADASDE
ncbi:Cobalt-zinc-cadmium resistance protein CzcA [Myxococcaceae bacterium]|nr:Cobalt-zinc-cadmium resistance protein CzcA [Myxococcaceae bacterium]